MSKPSSASYFIEQAINNFGSKLDFSTVQHKNANIKFTIFCPEHKEFDISSHSHLNSLYRLDSELERFIKIGISKNTVEHPRHSGRDDNINNFVQTMHSVRKNMNSNNMRKYIRLVEDTDAVLGYALRDQLGRFVSWKSGPGGDIKSGDHGISKSLRQMFPTKEAAENANNQRLENHRMMLEIWKKRQDSQQILILQKLIDTPVMIVAITARPVA